MSAAHGWTARNASSRSRLTSRRGADTRALSERCAGSPGGVAAELERDDRRSDSGRRQLARGGRRRRRSRSSIRATARPSPSSPAAAAEDIDAAVQAARAALGGRVGPPAGVRARPDPRPARPAGAGPGRGAGAARGEGLSASPCARRAPMRWRWPATSSSTAAPPTRSTARPSPTSRATPCSRCASRTASPATSSPGTTRCRSSGAASAAALAMGNACVLKPGEDASLTALAVGRLALEAGPADGRAQHRAGLGEEAGAALAAHPGIDHLSFTGSRAVGAWCSRRRAPRLPGDARARRQVAAAGVRRRRARPGPAVRRQRRDPERRPDLLGGLAPAVEDGLRRFRRRGRRALPHPRCRPRASATSTAGR